MSPTDVDDLHDGYDDDRARHRRTVAALSAGVEELRVEISRLPGVVAGLPPGAVGDAVAWCVHHLVDIGTALLDVLVEALHGSGAPFRFLDLARDWTDVRGTATGVVGELNPAVLPATGVWSGTAADAYARASKLQTDAAARIGAMASTMSAVLVQSALDGITFYVAVELILAKILAAVLTALLAAETVVLSPVAFGLCLEEAAVTPALLGSAVTALISSLGLQASHLVSLHGEAGDRSAFPAGRWPDATTGRYADASVTDGDADWSLRAP